MQFFKTKAGVIVNTNLIGYCNQHVYEINGIRMPWTNDDFKRFKTKMTREHRLEREEENGKSTTCGKDVRDAKSVG